MTSGVGAVRRQLHRRRLLAGVAGRAVSERWAGSGYGQQTNYGRTFVTLALMCATGLAWVIVLKPNAVWLLRTLAGGGLLLAYLGVHAWVRRSLNWLELDPDRTLVAKTEVDNFLSLSTFLTTAAGLSLLMSQPLPVAIFIVADVALGVIVYDFSRRLRREEIQKSGITYNVVNRFVHDKLRGLVLWQARFLLFALAAAVVIKFKG